MEGILWPSLTSDITSNRLRKSEETDHILKLNPWASPFEHYILNKDFHHIIAHYYHLRKDKEKKNKELAR